MNESVNNTDDMSGIKVLYIEDNPANIKLMQDIFSEFLSYELITVNNAEEGIELVNKYLPQLVLMDINMQGMNGFQALEILKSSAVTNKVPVIAISADAMPHQIEEGLAKGFADYLPKPFNINDLINRLKQRLG